MGDSNDPRLGEVLGLLSSLKGVKKAFYLEGPICAKLVETESEARGFGPLVVRNEGVLECLKRKHVACIVKDRSFRPPPHATVMLIDEDGVVIGKELLPGEEVEEVPGHKRLYLGKDFVMFYDGRSGRNAQFVLPPVPFAEVEALPFAQSVCSSSPSTIGDLMIRKGAGLDDDPRLATILVGFDLKDR
jgi:hypothetical protein